MGSTRHEVKCRELIPGAIPILEFDMRGWGRYGSSSRPLRVPVPKDRENEAEEVITKLLS